MSFFKNPLPIQSGGGTTLTRKRETFTATANQTDFKLTGSYEINKNRLDVLVGNVEQFSPDNFTEVDSKTIRFASGLAVGTKVVVSYFE